MKRRNFFKVVAGAVAAFIPMLRLRSRSRSLSEKTCRQIFLGETVNYSRSYGTIKIYDGLRPTDPNESPGSLLAEIKLAEPPNFPDVPMRGEDWEDLA